MKFANNDGIIQSSEGISSGSAQMRVVGFENKENMKADITSRKKQYRLFFDNHTHTFHEFGDYAINQYDYDDIVYPIPFNTVYHNKKSRYVEYGKKNEIFPEYVHTGDIRKSTPSDRMLFITGASSNHFFVSMNCLLVLAMTSPSTSIAYLDVGLTRKELVELQVEFEAIHLFHIRHNTTAELYYRKFDFSSFPTWLDINNKATRGGYSWKTITYLDMLNEWQGYASWIDAGSLLRDDASRELEAMKKEGLFAPWSSGTVKRYVYPSTYSFLHDMGVIRPIANSSQMCSSGHLFMDYHNEQVYQSVFMPFYQCAYTCKCISPYGSNRENHRQEQAVLTLLIHHMNLSYSANLHVSYIPIFNTDKRFTKLELWKPYNNNLREKINKM